MNTSIISMTEQVMPIFTYFEAELKASHWLHTNQLGGYQTHKRCTRNQGLNHFQTLHILAKHCNLKGNNTIFKNQSYRRLYFSNTNIYCTLSFCFFSFRLCGSDSMLLDSVAGQPVFHICRRRVHSAFIYTLTFDLLAIETLILS